MNDQTTPPPSDDDDTTPLTGDDDAKPTGDAKPAVVKVNLDTCIGCGICTSIAPEVFEMQDDGKSHVKNPDSSNAEDAKGACPVGAITIE